MKSQVGWNVGHNLSIGGRELPYSGTHLKGIVTDVQVSKLPISKSHFVLKIFFRLFQELSAWRRLSLTPPVQRQAELNNSICLKDLKKEKN